MDEPKVFISYSWTNQSHQELVKHWADRLIADGVEDEGKPVANMSRLDKAVLVQIVEMVETALSKKPEPLSATKKGELVFLLYEQAMKNSAAGQPTDIDMSNVVNLIDYAS